MGVILPRTAESPARPRSGAVGASAGEEVETNIFLMDTSLDPDPPNPPARIPRLNDPLLDPDQSQSPGSCS